MNPENTSDSDSTIDEADEGRLERDTRSVAESVGYGLHVQSPLLDGSSTSMGNPNFEQTMQLFSRTNHFLAASIDGCVYGTQDKNDIHTILEISNAGHPGHVRIMSLLSRVYIAMNKQGNLYPESNMWVESTVFIESLHGAYNTYLSRINAHKGWYLGIKKSGKKKPGPKTAARQKAIMFLPVRRRREFE